MFPIKELMVSILEMSPSQLCVWWPSNFRLYANKNILDSTHFFLIKIPSRTEGALLPHPSFLSSMVKYVNKMSKVILQRGTKEKRGAEGKDSHKIPPILHNISQRGASFQPEPSSRGASSLHRITHRKSHTHKKIKIFSASAIKARPPLPSPLSPSLY